MLQTADGATKAMTDMLTRMRELAIQASNDTYGTSDAQALNTEFGELRNAMTSIINDTSWNGKKLLNGETASATYQVGASGVATDGVTASFTSLSSLTVFSAAGLTSRTDALAAITSTENDLATINTSRSAWGAVMNRLSRAADNSGNVSMNLSASKSRLVDADYAKATADLARAQIIEAAGTAMLSQANQQGRMVLQLLR
jgi:flagellin